MRHGIKKIIALIIPLILVSGAFSPDYAKAYIWTQVNTDGFGDVNNTCIRPMSVFDNNLYAGTKNAATGCEVWEYDSANWNQVNTDGFGNPNNTYATSMGVAFGGL